MPFASLILAAQLAVTQVAPPPVTPAQQPPVIESAFGIDTPDPDRWLEQLDSPKVQAWARQQNDYTRKVLDSIPGRADLLERIRKADGQEASMLLGAVRLPDGRVLAHRMLPGQAAPKLYLRDGLDGAERLLLDPARFASSADVPASITWMKASPDGRLLAVGVDESGSEDASLHLLDIATGKSLMPSIPHAHNAIGWLPDGSGFLYDRWPAPDPTIAPDKQRQNIPLLLHRIGTDVQQDRVVFGMQIAPPSLDLLPQDKPKILMEPGSRWMIAWAYGHADGTRIKVWAAPLADLNQPKIGWRKLIVEADNVRKLTLRGDTLYLLRSDVPNRRIDALDLPDPDAKPTAFIPEGSGAIDDLAAASDALYYSMAAGSGVGVELHRRRWDADASEHITSPGADTMDAGDVKPDQPGALAWTSGWARFLTVLVVDADGNVRETTLQPPPEGVDTDAVEARVVEVPSHDGVLVPLSIIMPRGAPRDGRTPFILSGYGAYSTINSVPALFPSMVANAQLGMGWAECAVRGGGEKGEAWYRGGLKASKPNTWKDFIACADYLVREGYTSPDRLAGMGTSAGGIMVTNAMVERPELFALLVSNVGVADMLGFAQRDPNGKANHREFGDPVIEAEYRGLLAMSAYQKLRPGTAYPAVLLLHGMNDSRVAPWQAFKFGARVQRESSSGKPVLIDLAYDGGHGAAGNSETRYRFWADVRALLLWQAGVPEFQPRAAFSQPVDSPGAKP